MTATEPMALSYDALAVARAEQEALGLRAESVQVAASALTVPARALGTLVPAGQIVAEAEAHRQAAMADLAALRTLLLEMAAALGHTAADLGQADAESAGQIGALDRGLDHGLGHGLGHQLGGGR